MSRRMNAHGRKRQDAWDAGYTAAVHGKTRAACREEAGTVFYDDWCDGYEEGTRHRERGAA